MTTYNFSGCTVDLDDATQSATIYRDERPIGTVQRRRVLDYSEPNWRIFDLNGQEVRAIRHSISYENLARLACMYVERARREREAGVFTIRFQYLDNGDARVTGRGPAWIKLSEERHGGRGPWDLAALIDFMFQDCRDVMRSACLRRPFKFRIYEGNVDYYENPSLSPTVTYWVYYNSLFQTWTITTQPKNGDEF